MAITRQLFQLQELDTEIEHDESSLESKLRLLGDRTDLDAAAACLADAQKALDELKHRHKDAERQVDDILAKIATAEEQLYSGRTTSPKELSNLQHEISILRTHSDELEDKTLEIIDCVENAEREVASADTAYRRTEEEWQSQQRQLAGEIEQLKAALVDLKQRRQQLNDQIDPSSVALYEKVRQQKKQAVARVEQGICCACRISLSASALQRARTGQPVQCGTCGRILYIS
jgi:predicted  nucleic acid-binding Zn-ribbon protein